MTDETNRMASDLAAANSRRGHNGLVIAAAVLAVLAVVVVAALLFAPLPVHADGRLVWVTRGTTVSRLMIGGQLAAPRGDLLSVNGLVLRAGGGHPPSVLMRGAVVPSSTPIGFLDDVTSARGGDVTESVVTTDIVTPPSVTYSGTGPYISVETSGANGVVRVEEGAVSKVEVSRTVIRLPVEMVLLRHRVTGKKVVALTFDDGPWPGQTDKILGILLKFHVKATFFEIGSWARHYATYSRLVVTDGMEIGDHSETHKLLAHASHSVITHEIGAAAQVIAHYSGVRPLWYRPAGGSVNPFVYEEAKRLGLNLVLWTLDPNDWRKPGTKVIVRRVVGQVRPGSVVLMHDGGGDRSQTIAALPLILKWLHEKGYTCLTLSQMYGIPWQPYSATSTPAPAKP
jgi:peptidoglycan/xylan/chitin deacetylase (PgdA/CDA1 family)